jgi:hypothetical protein
VPACDLLSIPAAERAAHIGLARSLLFREAIVAPSQEVPAVRDLGEERA